MTRNITPLKRMTRLGAAALIGFVVFMPTVTACSASAEDETEQVEEEGGSEESEESEEQENDSEETENESNEED